VKTQYERIAERMSGHQYWFTYHELAQLSNCVWKRLAEMEAKGFTFARRPGMVRNRRVTMVKLTGRPQ